MVRSTSDKAIIVSVSSTLSWPMSCSDIAPIKCFALATVAVFQLEGSPYTYGIIIYWNSQNNITAYRINNGRDFTSSRRSNIAID